MKKEILERFNNLYEGKRLLAVQLNGFSHKVFYDNGNANGSVTVEEFSPWTKMERQTKQSEMLLGSFSTYAYKGDPKEIIYITPEAR